MCKDASSQVHTLRRIVKEKDETIQRQCNLEKKIHQLEKQGTLKIQRKGDSDISIMPFSEQGSALLADTPAIGGANIIGTAGPQGGAIPEAMSLPPPAPPLPPETGTGMT